MIYYIMGVTSSGKSTVGKLLAEKLNIPFLDGDDFHPKANIQKMSQGIPLTDEDRRPWLENINATALEEAEKDGAVIACSALKKSYREILQSNIEAQTQWIFLFGSKGLIQKRIGKRKGHFMSPELVQSQFDTLEPPSNEQVLRVDISKSPEELVVDILDKLGD